MTVTVAVAVAVTMLDRVPTARFVRSSTIRDDVDLDALDLPAFLKIDRYVGDAVGRRQLRH